MIQKRLIQRKMAKNFGVRWRFSVVPSTFLQFLVQTLINYENLKNRSLSSKLRLIWRVKNFYRQNVIPHPPYWSFAYLYLDNKNMKPSNLNIIKTDTSKSNYLQLLRLGNSQTTSSRGVLLDAKSVGSRSLNTKLNL